MPYHTFAYTLAIGAVAGTDVPAVQDDIIQIQNSHFVLPFPLRLGAALVYSPTFLAAQLVSPTLRQINPVLLRAGNASAIAVPNPNMYFPPGGGTQIHPFEETQILGSAAPGTTERFTAVLFAYDTMIPTAVGDVYPIGWTSAGTAVANLWTSIPLNLTTVIPSGQYMMVMSEHWSTNAIAHRFIISNQYLRPGNPSQVSASGRQPDAWVIGNMCGEMGPFKSNDLPRIQVLCNAADAAHTGTIWAIRTGNI